MCDHCLPFLISEFLLAPVPTSSCGQSRDEPGLWRQADPHPPDSCPCCLGSESLPSNPRFSRLCNGHNHEAYPAGLGFVDSLGSSSAIVCEGNACIFTRVSGPK